MEKTQTPGRISRILDEPLFRSYPIEIQKREPCIRNRTIKHILLTHTCEIQNNKHKNYLTKPALQTLKMPI